MDQPLPPALPDDPLTAFFWEGARDRELQIQRCQRCGTYIHLPRPVCRNCHSFDLAGERGVGAGTLYSFTETLQGRSTRSSSIGCRTSSPRSPSSSRTGCSS